MTEQDILNDVYQQALDLYQSNGLPPTLSAPYSGYIDVIVAHREQNKGVLAVLTTLLVKKLHTPGQDIRQHQVQLSDGFSGRGLDTKVVTPFLRDQRFPHMQSGSGWLTRSLEQSNSYDLNYPGNISPAPVKQAFLGLVDGVQRQGLSAESILIGIIGIFTSLIRFRQQNANLILSRPANLSFAQVVDKIRRHHNQSMPGVSRLPVLAIHAILTISVKEVGRFVNCTILPLEHHNTADVRTNLIGDVHIVDVDNTLIEGYEVKHNIPISSNLIQTSLEKLHNTPVQTLYILTTYHHDSYSEFQPDIQRADREHGCQLIVNGVYPTLLYYLRLTGRAREFMDAYATNLETDPSVTYQLKEVWNEIAAS